MDKIPTVQLINACISKGGSRVKDYGVETQVSGMNENMTGKQSCMYAMSADKISRSFKAEALKLPRELIPLCLRFLIESIHVPLTISKCSKWKAKYIIRSLGTLVKSGTVDKAEKLACLKQ